MRILARADGRGDGDLLAVGAEPDPRGGLVEGAQLFEGVGVVKRHDTAVTARAADGHQFAVWAHIESPQRFTDAG